MYLGNFLLSQSTAKSFIAAYARKAITVIYDCAISAKNRRFELLKKAFLSEVFSCASIGLMFNITTERRKLPFDSTN